MSLTPLLQDTKQPKPFTSGCVQSDQQKYEVHNQRALACFEHRATHLGWVVKAVFIRHLPSAVRCFFRSADLPISRFTAVPSFVLAANDCNEVKKMMAKVKTRQAKRKVADMTVDELAELVRQILRDELKFLCSVDDEGNLVFWCEEAYAKYVELLGKKPSEVKAYWVEGGMKFRYSDDEVTPELAKELDEAKRDIEAGRLIPYEQVRDELGL